MDVVLGFDTSCYTTSVSVVTTEGEVLCNSRKLLPVESGKRGLRQNDALFFHIKQLNEVLSAATEFTHNNRVVAVCSSTKPRNEENSYMPVFKAGDTMGRGIASVLGVPFFSTDHQTGHVYAAAYHTDIDSSEKFMAVHLSGGTSELLTVNECKIERIGGSLDLHAGQLIDRVGVAMQLPFPAGPELEKMAIQGHAQALLPTSMEQNGLFFHLSGCETKCMQWIESKQYSMEQIASEVFDLIARSVTKMIVAGEKLTGIHSVLIAGGVSSSLHIRDMILQRSQKLSRTLKVSFGDPQYSGDNAVGVALRGIELYKQGGDL